MKSTIDYSEIVSLSGINEIEQLVTTYYIKYYRAPKDLKVEILQSLKDGMLPVSATMHSGVPANLILIGICIVIPRLNKHCIFQSMAFGIMINPTIRMTWFSGDPIMEST